MIMGVMQFDYNKQIRLDFDAYMQVHKETDLNN